MTRVISNIFRGSSGPGPWPSWAAAWWAAGCEEGAAGRAMQLEDWNLDPHGAVALAKRRGHNRRREEIPIRDRRYVIIDVRDLPRPELR